MSSSVETQPSSRSFVTRLALIWMNLTNEPFVAFYALLPFIMRKDLNATILHITLFFSIKGVIPVFSFYWSANLTRQRGKLRSNLIWAWIIGRVPFLCLPFIDNIWFLIFAAAVYQFFYRAGTPSLMEILKLNLGKKRREKLFSRLYVLSFMESTMLALFLGKLLDMHLGAWKILFSLSALLSLSSLLLQMRITLPENLEADKKIPPITTNRLLQPIKDCIYLMRSRPDFAHFQWGFMIGGFGLLLIQPALAIFYADSLNLSHDQITIARHFWTGIGVIASSFLWHRGLGFLSTSQLTACITFLFSLFPLFLLFAQKGVYWLNVALLSYGVAEAGSHVVWTLSGTLFARNEDSSKFTGANIFMLGLRGLIAPALGGNIAKITGPLPVLIAGGVICISGTIYMVTKRVAIPKKVAS